MTEKWHKHGFSQVRVQSPKHYVIKPHNYCCWAHTGHRG